MDFEEKKEEIFAAAIEIEDRSERDSYIAQACGENRELLESIQKLLYYHDENSFLDVPALEAVTGEEISTLTEHSGMVIGRYKLLERIGEGGMAVVYMAEQERPIRRKVALKIIKLGMDTRQVIARFEAERQALAMMDHPNIAKVLDAGATETGRPYFVMELVTGVSITEYCDKNNLNTRERLGLFMQVCNAVQHAHQKGIIHRDIKPTNVLVTMQDGKAVPKVIDFGIAKATKQRLTEKTLFTRYAHIIGTPAYMSPEQAELSDIDIDTRTDIYSLGILLYELLTGTTPFSEEQLRKAGYIEMQRVIREEEPTKPSTKLSTLGETLTDIAKHRGCTPDLLRKAIRGDLDWIVMRFLEKERKRRYEAANTLAMDIQRHLTDEPVSARPPSARYKLHKFARRYRATLVAAVMIAAILITGSGIATWQAIRATKAMRREAKERERADQQLYDSLVGEARAIRLARSVGYRWEAWNRLQKAYELEIPKKDIEILRREAVSCMGDFVGIGPTVLDDFPAGILSIALNPQDSLIAVGLADGTVSLRSLDTGAKVDRMPTETPGEYNSLPLAFGQDGKTLLTAQAKEILNTWKMDGTGTWTSKIIPVGGRVLHISTADDGRLFALCSTEVPGEILIWRFSDGESDKLCVKSPGKLRCVTLSPDGSLLAVGFIVPGRTLGLTLWDAETGDLVKTLTPQRERGFLRNLDFSSDGSLLVCACDDGLVVYDTKSFNAVWSVGDMSEVAAISPASNHVAFSSRQLNVVRLWNFARNRQVVALEHSEQPICVKFGANGLNVVIASDRSVYIWRINTSEKKILLGHGSNVSGAAFSPDGNLVASISADRTLRIWDPLEGKVLRVWDLPGHGETVAFSADGQLLAAGGAFISIWDTVSWKKLCDLDVGPETVRPWIWKVAFSSDGRYFTATGGGLALWRLEYEAEDRNGDISFEFIRQLSTTNFTRHVCFSPNSQLLAWAEGFRNSTVHIWDVPNRREMPGPQSRVFSSAESLAFFPDSRHLVFFSEDRTIEIWDVIERQRKFVLPGAERQETAEGTYNKHLSLSPNGRWFAADSFSGRAVNIWDTQDRRLLLSLPEQDSAVHRIAWNPDSNLLAVGRSDGVLVIWNLESVRDQLGQLGFDW